MNRLVIPLLVASLGQSCSQKPSGDAIDLGTIDTASPDTADSAEMAVDVAPAPDMPAGCRYPMFGAAEAVPIAGYDGVVMEPFLARDGSVLFFNDSNDPDVDTNLHFARASAGGFTYVGELTGANSTVLDGVASFGPGDELYFVSLRSYDTSFSTVYRGTFANDEVTAIALVPGVSREEALWVNFDAEISADGQTLYYVDGLFDPAMGLWTTADLVIGARDGDAFTRRSDSDTLLAEVNSELWEYAPATTVDELELYFTRADPANGVAPQNWMTTRTSADSPFCPPIRIVEEEGFVEASTLAADGTVYFHKRVGTGFALFRVSPVASP